MFLQQLTALRYLLAMVLVFSLAGSIVLPTFGGIALNTIDPAARMTERGQLIFITGPITCTAGERVTLHITVTQRSTGAVGQGRTRFTCAGVLQQWEARAVSHGTALFEEGPATAVALARTRARGVPTDAHQWLAELTLLE